MSEPGDEALLRDARQVLAEWNSDFEPPGDVGTVELIERISVRLGEPGWVLEAP